MFYCCVNGSGCGHADNHCPGSCRSLLCFFLVSLHWHVHHYVATRWTFRDTDKNYTLAGHTHNYNTLTVPNHTHTVHGDSDDGPGKSRAIPSLPPCYVLVYVMRVAHLTRQCGMFTSSSKSEDVLSIMPKKKRRITLTQVSYSFARCSAPRESFNIFMF